MHSHVFTDGPNAVDPAGFAHDVFLELLGKLLAVPASSSYESAMAQVICSEIRMAGFEPIVDAGGNVLVRIEGTAAGRKPMILAAHMDEIAAIVTGVDDDGALHVSCAHTPSQKWGEGPVEIVGDERSITGVLSFGSGHGQPREDALQWRSARVITGLGASQIAQAGVRPGSPVTPVAWRRGPIVFGQAHDPLIGAWTFDDRAGVIMLLRLLRSWAKDPFTPKRTMIVAFTVHEEGGCHGAKNLARQWRPEIFVGVDGAAMLPGTNLELDGGPCVWVKDRLACSDRQLIRQFQAAAALANHPLQMAVFESPYADASSVHDAGFAHRVITFGHVRENSHGFEVARRSCLEQAQDILERFVRLDV